MPKQLQPWLRVDVALLHSAKVQRLTAAQFKRQFMAAANGEVTLLSPFIEGPFFDDRPYAHEWRVIRDRIFRRDDYTCHYCGERGRKLECDHVMPVARGGRHDDDNLVTACFACNRSKRDKTVEEWRA